MTESLIQKQISDLISSNKVVLFMKGSADAPMCGFSSTVVQILKMIKTEFIAINILESEEMREGIKIFSDWPTIPQLYINGEFIGGCDITREMYQTGELQELLSK